MSIEKITAVMSGLLAEWGSPRIPSYMLDASLEMPLMCSALPSDGRFEPPDALPNDLVIFWAKYSTASLFIDVTYGQWGLNILTYDSSNLATESHFKETYTEPQIEDRIIGEFVGDAEKLLIRCDSLMPDFGHIVVVARDAFRREWYTAAESLSSFLEDYEKYEGQKYWEAQFTKPTDLR